MASNGTATFSSPDDYQTGIGGATSKGASVNLIVTGGGDFRARLTWLNLHGLRLLCGSENLPSVAYVSCRRSGGGAVSDQHGAVDMGRTRLRFGDIVFHSRGERTHRWTPGASRWGLISLPPEQLAACGLALTGQKITAPPSRRVLRPPRAAAAMLLRLHAQSLPSCRKAA